MDVFQGTKVVEKGEFLLLESGRDHEIGRIRRSAANDRKTSENVLGKGRYLSAFLLCCRP